MVYHLKIPCYVVVLFRKGISLKWLLVVVGIGICCEMQDKLI